MPYYQQVSPISIAIDCLNSTKYLVLRDAYGAMETTTPQLRHAFSRMAQEHLGMADEWFRLMQSRGWYQVPQARPEMVAQAMNQFQTVISQSQGAPVTTGVQQFGVQR
ncbi:MAG: spore coat protein [Bacillota bacterium]